MEEELDYMDEIVSEFVIETTELLEQLDADLIALEKRPNDLELINQIFRAIHTIKGTSGFLGFEKMSRLTHVAEDILNRMRKGNLQITPEIMDALLETIDCLRKMLDSVKESGGEGEHEVKALINKLNVVHQSNQNKKQPVAQKVRDQFAIQNEADEGEKTEAPQDQEKMPSASTVPAEESERQGKHPESTREKQLSQTVRVPVERLDQLMNLVGELVLGRNRLNQITSYFEASATATHIDNSYSGAEEIGIGQIKTNFREKHIDMLAESNALISLITSELQMAILQTRMLPVETLFRKVPRLLRDLCREMNKDVELIIEGADTELDKSVIEQLGDPLTHLIRNSIDHGIESADKRQAAGKPSQGKLRLFASQQGNHIIVGIEDDGAGIDPDKIKSVAIKKGLISAAEAHRMNNREAINLIFTPGFSTKARATKVSGRGVGMDVVKTNVMRLNGMIEVNSQTGQGTTFLLKLPLTLAIIQGLIVRVANETFIVPIVSVLEAVKIRENQLNCIGNQRVLRLRDAIVPVVDLCQFFNLRRADADPEEFYVVLVAIANKKIGLIVDRLLGQEEVVIKSLGDFFTDSEAFAGATIMGDGRVRLIIDVAEIVRQLQGKTV